MHTLVVVRWRLSTKSGKEKNVENLMITRAPGCATKLKLILIYTK